MAGRPTKAEMIGLTEEIWEESDGRYGGRLSDPSGETLIEKVGYRSFKGTRDGLNLWIRKNYRTSQTPKKPQPSGQSGHLLGMIRKRAMENESQAQRLRSQADLLETEAKRLHAAADILEAPEGLIDG